MACFCSTVQLKKMGGENNHASLLEKKASLSHIDAGVANRDNTAMVDQESGNKLEESISEMSIETDNNGSSGRLGSKSGCGDPEPDTNLESQNIALPEVCSTEVRLLHFMVSSHVPQLGLICIFR